MENIKVIANMYKEYANQNKAIEDISKVMLENNAASENYVNSIYKRNEVSSLYIGNYLAIPHGSENMLGEVKHNLIIINHLKTPIMWDGNETWFIIGLALKGDSHIEALGNLASNFMDLNLVNDIYKNPTIEKLEGLLA